jgi:hypothetical protein
MLDEPFTERREAKSPGFLFWGNRMIKQQIACVRAAVKFFQKASDTASVWLATACILLSLTGGANAQARPGCAYGSQTLPGVAKATDGAIERSFTVCPGARARICVVVEKGKKLKIDINHSGPENIDIKRLCKTVRTKECESIEIGILNDFDYTIYYHMSCR